MTLEFEKVWNEVKASFDVGKDYIESETDEYIVFCPFNYDLLYRLDKILCRKNTLFRFQHCVCHSFGAFEYWYNGLYRDGRLKAFFVKKNLNVYNYVYNLTEEFTGWIDYSDRHFLHFAHLADNSLVTGFYHSYQYDYAFSRRVEEGRGDIADFMAQVVDEVFDDLFAQYDAHIEILEHTLRNNLERNA